MQIHHLSESNSVLNHFLEQIRNVEVQGDRMRFRRNIERIGEIMAYELSKKLQYQAAEITTPLGIKKSELINEALVLCSILRAGLPLHNGFLNYFDSADSGFISAFRHHYEHDSNFEIILQYQALPSIQDKCLILLDPMLATGKSIVAVLNKLMEDKKPKEIHIAVVLATPEGVSHLKENLPDQCHLWIASLDEKLNENDYIVPGLGDAGDLCFGRKL